MSYKIIQGDNIDTLKQYPDNHFDSIVTDPPYGIAFLGKDWDNNTGAVETWEECLRVLKPGGYLLAFSAARTYHHLATNIEGVGFDIRDQLMWLYASGFPKAQDIGKAIDKRAGNIHKNPQYQQNTPETLTKFMKNIGCIVCGTRSKNPNGTGYYCGHSQDPKLIDPEAKQWAGWKTALKPGHEPIVMARKPFKGSTIDNVLEHGTGALNIDATRIEWQPGEQEKEQLWRERYMEKNVGGPTFQETNIKKQKKGGLKSNAPKGRFPSNVIGEVKDYQKYFYSPKVSRAERHCGFELEDIPDPLENYSQGDVKNHPLWDPSIGTNLQRLKHKILEHNKDLKPLAHIPAPFGDVKGCYQDGERFAAKHQEYQKETNVGNNHPTVKPIELMKYLIKLVTPPEGTVLDPFTGSGSTGMAATELEYNFIGCELDSKYVDIANKRIEGWYKRNEPINNFQDLFKEVI